MNQYYTEPEKEKGSTGQYWKVERREKGTKKFLEKYQFHGENAAWDFLKTINIYINGVVVYTGK